MGTTQLKDSQLLDRGRENNQWINENMSELRSEYGGEFIAVEDRSVIADSPDESTVVDEVEEKAEHPSSVIITYIHESGKKIIR